jgi:plasmid maintenance system antidote protein VapI
MTQTTAITPYRSLGNAAGNNDLLDMLLDKPGMKNDAALDRALEVAPPVISKIRHGRLPIGASLLIRMHEVFDVSIRELKRIARAEVPA